MTSLGRAGWILLFLTIANVCANGSQVEHWNVRAYLLLIGGAATTLAQGLSKSLRDAALSDASPNAPPLPGQVENRETTTEVKSTVTSSEEGKDEKP